MKVIIFPHAVGNPYQGLLAKELERRGSTVVLRRRPSLREAWKCRRPHDLILNLHWQDLMTKANIPGLSAGVFQVVAGAHLVILLLLAQLRGARVVWTIHNLGPHEPCRPLLDGMLAWVLAKLADDVLVHSHYAGRQVEGRLRRPGLRVAPHGNYLGAYPPPTRSRSEVRAALGIPADARVFLAFGQIRRYKGLPRLITAFRKLADPGVRLLIVGSPGEAGIGDLTGAIDGDPRVILQARRIPDSEVCELHVASDVAALAYEDVFSSGALLLALSCGLPTVAPANSTATEIAPEPVVRGYRAGDLTQALKRSLDDGPEAREEALAVACGLTWAEMATAILGSQA